MKNNKIINQELKKSLVEILKDPRNVVIKETTISGNSIDVEYRDTDTSSTFCYYDRIEDRDNDLKTIIELLTIKDEKNGK